MPEIGKKIRFKREQLNMTQEELAKRLGYKSKTTIAKIENGTNDIVQSKVVDFANALDTTVAYLMGWEDEDHQIPKDPKVFDNIFPISAKRFPLLGEIACGEPIFANEDRESYIMAGTDIDADFCLKAKGDSMIGARILDGDIVFIKETSIVDNGDIAAVAVDDEVLLKRFEYSKEENILALHSENPRYKTKRYSGEQLDHIRVLGKAVAFQSDVF